MILNYPVISFADSLTHYGSRFQLVGPVLPPEELGRIMQDWQNNEAACRKIPVDPAMKALYSNELQVKPDTPPTFITSAVD